MEFKYHRKRPLSSLSLEVGDICKSSILDIFWRETEDVDGTQSFTQYDRGANDVIVMYLGDGIMAPVIALSYLSRRFFYDSQVIHVLHRTDHGHLIHSTKENQTMSPAEMTEYLSYIKDDSRDRIE
jgi:hypothetical protein